MNVDSTTSSIHSFYTNNCFWRVAKGQTSNSLTDKNHCYWQLVQLVQLKVIECPSLPSGWRHPFSLPHCIQWTLCWLSALVSLASISYAAEPDFFAAIDMNSTITNTGINNQTDRAVKTIPSTIVGGTRFTIQTENFPNFYPRKYK